ncbi:MAG: glycosyltransferase [Chitinophagales bacterium]|nr:glycosyltransferase [Chitinophagales bacterium]
MDVSVIILCYNHEKYIAQALESVLGQKTNFNFNIIIADDGSTDKTVETITGYQKQNIDKIILLKSEKNKGVLANAIATISSIKSRYIALLDGDDYWTFSGKLQAQYDFLESNKEYTGCFHNANIVQQSDAEKILFNSFSSYAEIYTYPADVYPWDLTNRLILPTSSLFLKSDFLKDSSFKFIDDGFSIAWKISCLAIKYAKFKYIKETWSVYRNHLQGISKNNTINFHLSHISFLKRLINDDYYKNIPFEIYQSIASEYYILINKLMKNTNAKISLKIKKDYVISEVKKVYYLFKKTNTDK